MSDIIKREDAIKAVAQDLMYESCIQSEYASDELSDWIEVAKVMLEEVPSADRPQGHYIKGESGEWYCSNCKRIDDKYSVARFCWWCGAKMKGADDE